MSRPASTQRDRVLRLLRHAAGAGVRTSDFSRPIDGGPPIGRAASRITELRHLGHSIETRREPTGPCGGRQPRYVLVEAPQHAEHAKPAAPLDPLPTLLAVSADPPGIASPYDPWSDTA